MQSNFSIIPVKAELVPAVILSLTSIDILCNITSDVGSPRSSIALYIKLWKSSFTVLRINNVMING